MNEPEPKVKVDHRNAVRNRVRTEYGGEFTTAFLQELADGPILDPLRIYLPAGRLSAAAAAARDRQAMRGRE